MTKPCNPGDFKIRKASCPDCRRSITDPPENGKKQCNKCLQYVEFIDGLAIRAIPKDLV